MKFSERIRSLGCVSYAEYLNSTHWREFKKRYASSGLPRSCAVCSGGPYQLHHCNYDRLGHEAFADVVPLCDAHHDKVHEWLKANGKGVGSTRAAIVAIKETDWQPPPTLPAMPALTRRQRKQAKRHAEMKAAPKLPPTNLPATAAHEEAKKKAADALAAHRAALPPVRFTPEPSGPGRNKFPSRPKKDRHR